MKWMQPLERFVEVLVITWLFSIFVKPFSCPSTRGKAQEPLGMTTYS